jgi:hypothetical protein
VKIDKVYQVTVDSKSQIVVLFNEQRYGVTVTRLTGYLSNVQGSALFLDQHGKE